MILLPIYTYRYIMKYLYLNYPKNLLVHMKHKREVWQGYTQVCLFFTH